MKKTRVAILFGGPSEEYSVSLKSAYSIISAIDHQRYDLVAIGITRDGQWLKYEGQPRALLSDTWQGPDLCRPAFISPDRSVHGIIEMHGQEAVVTRIDAVFPVLHGKCGEDGAIQGLLELAGIPYVGCRISSSVLCMDKELAYRIVQSAGIKTPAFNTHYRDGLTEAPAPDEGLCYPLFVKPANSGSSFGVSKVEAPFQLPDAIAEAARFDHKILIEQAVEGQEVGCAVMGQDGKLVTGEVDQIELSEGFFRIHQESDPEAGSENSVIHVPARIGPALRTKVQEHARRIYSALGCTGLARVDMFLTPDEDIILNEVNTMPGFTSYSRYPRMMAAGGLALPQVIENVISLAMAGVDKED